MRTQVRFSYNLACLELAKILWTTPRKDRQMVCTYCIRNGSCVGSDIGWSVSIDLRTYSRANGYRQAAQILLLPPMSGYDKLFSAIVTCSSLLQTADWQTLFGYIPCVLWPDTLTTDKFQLCNSSLLLAHARPTMFYIPLVLWYIAILLQVIREHNILNIVSITTVIQEQQIFQQ